MDPATFTMNYCERAMRDNPIETAALYGNIQRLLQGKPWVRHYVTQPKLRKPTAQRLSAPGIQANGGLPHTAKANHA